MSRGFRPAIEFVRDADAGSLPGPKGSKCGKRAFSASKSVKKGVFRPENVQKREKSQLSFNTVAKTTRKLNTCSRSSIREKKIRQKNLRSNPSERTVHVFENRDGGWVKTCRAGFGRRSSSCETLTSVSEVRTKGSKCGKRAFSASQSVKKGVFRPENLQKREKSQLSFRTVAKTTIRIDRFMSQALGQPDAQAKRRQEN